MQAGSNASTKRKRAPRVAPLVRFDNRTREGRRFLELRSAFLAALEVERPSPNLLRKVETAAQLVVIAETARAEFIDSRGVTLNDVVRVENKAANAVEQLQLPEERAASVPVARGIRAHLIKAAG